MPAWNFNNWDKAKSLRKVILLVQGSDTSVSRFGKWSEEDGHWIVEEDGAYRRVLEAMAWMECI